jgi:hypothetical protein
MSEDLRLARGRKGWRRKERSKEEGKRVSAQTESEGNGTGNGTVLLNGEKPCKAILLDR